MTDLEQLQGAVIALREALEAISQPNKHLNIWAKYAPRMPDVVVMEHIANNALSSTSELAQQIRAEIERNVISELAFAIRQKAEDYRSNDTPADDMVANDLDSLADELEGGKKG